MIGSRFINNRGSFVVCMLALGVVIFVVLRVPLSFDLGLAVALAFGIPSLIYASVQFDVAADTIDKLVKLEHQLSTRRLDDAPRFMPDIVALLEKAKQDIFVFCDFPAYGAASDPDEYARYRRAICDQPHGVSVKMLCLDESARRKLASEFYKDTANSDVRKRFPQEAQFLSFVAAENRQALDGHFKEAETFETSLVMPLYFWIVDNEAVFSLRRFTIKGAVEVGFQTSDRPLVAALREIFGRYDLVSKRYTMVKKDDEQIAVR